MKNLSLDQVTEEVKNLKLEKLQLTKELGSLKNKIHQLEEQNKKLRSQLGQDPGDNTESNNNFEKGN